MTHDQTEQENNTEAAAEAAKQPEQAQVQAEQEQPAADPVDILTKERDGLKDQLMRMAAENENIRKRMEREKQEAHKYATTSFARDLLAVVDNFKRAMAALDDGAAEETSSTATLIEGIKLTRNELLSVLKRHGIKEIESDNQKFDPNLHQAMIEIEVEGVEAGTIVETYQAGYHLNDRLLRPAMVSVAK